MTSLFAEPRCQLRTFQGVFGISFGISQINEAYERLLRSDVKYRFVIDMASLK